MLPDLMDEIKYLLQCEKKKFFLYKSKQLLEPSTSYQYFILNNNIDIFVTSRYLSFIESTHPQYVIEANALRKKYYKWFIKPVITVNELIFMIISNLYQSNINTIAKLKTYLIDDFKTDITLYEEFIDFIGKKLPMFMNMQYHHYLNTIVYEIYHFDRYVALKDIAKKYIKYVALHKTAFRAEIVALLRKHRIDRNKSPIIEPFRFNMMDLISNPIYTEDVHNRVNQMRQEMRLPMIPSPFYKSSRTRVRRIVKKRKIAKK